MVGKIKDSFFGVLEKVLPYEEYEKIRMAYRRMTTPMVGKSSYQSAYFLSKSLKAKEKYCIFRLQLPGYSLFAAGIQYIFMYDWAIAQGYIPLFDIEYDYNFQRYLLGEDNIWEYCFEQPISVKEALKKEWVFVESIGNGQKYRLETCVDINGRPEDHYIHAIEKGWREYYKKVNQYIQKAWVFKKSFLDECQKEYSNIMSKSDKVLGVFLRETFSKDAEKYRTNNTAKKVYNNHPMTIGIRDTVQLVKEYMEKWNCNKVFLATLMQDSIDLFVEELGDKVNYIERNRRGFLSTMVDANSAWNMSNQDVQDYYKKKYGERHLYESTYAYAKEVCILSYCDCLIAAKSSGAAVALSLNAGKYEEIFILPDFNNIERY